VGSRSRKPLRSLGDDAPRFEIRRFIFDGARLVPREQLEEDTSLYGPQRTFATCSARWKSSSAAYSQAGWSAVQVVLPEQELSAANPLPDHQAKIGRVIIEGNKHFDEANIRASVLRFASKAPNINEIARNLRVANENPSKQCSPAAQRQEEATVDAVVRVVDENPSKNS